MLLGSICAFVVKWDEFFRFDYVSKVLAPTLSEGDIVICDNLSSHKVAGVAEAIESFPAEHCRGFFRLAQYATV